MNDENLKRHLISRVQMNILSEEYKKNNYNLVNKGRSPGKPDSLAVYFDLQVLENYLQYVRREAKARGVENPMIKIGFGQYPGSEVIDQRENEKYKGYQTLYLCPVEKEDVNAQEATANDEAKGGAGSDNKDSLDDVDGLNFGGLRPPYPPY